jgi:hypothetical protein
MAQLAITNRIVAHRHSTQMLASRTRSASPLRRITAAVVSYCALDLR